MRRSRTSKTSAMGNMRFRGTSRFRSSVKGECSEKARFTCGNSSVSFRIPGMTPTVETFIRREEKPSSSGDVRMRSASKTRGLPRGSPMPISETLSTFWPHCRKWRTWSQISSASSCRFRPTLPVAQNAHWKAQPTCEEMQSERCDLNCRDTASTRVPSRKDRRSTLCAKSPSLESPGEKLETYFPKRSLRRHRRPFGRPSMACHLLRCVL
mmetsp:Transcript_24873/g.78385  ORF Transcript_24873/g.78385 Transcript_24873/m.78385 type:complete len:211 (+) Transcript_24873:526-1158(+)